ncbi:MAG: hypothetical protein Q4B42_06200 [Oscillospiraceae bacterium]|nr:hypothetical protein [Oscillospiraceae bacterium]
MKLTTREKTLLGILALVFIAAAFVLLLRSFSTRISDKQAELDALTVEANSIRSTIESIDEMQTQIPVLQESTKQLKTQFYTVKRNREFDSIISSLADSSGLTPVSLTISDAENGPISSYYSAGEEVSEEQSGYIWRSEAQFTAEGTVEEMYAFLDALHSDDALRLSSISYELPASSAGSTSFSFTIEIYMYEG